MLLILTQLTNGGAGSVGQGLPALMLTQVTWYLRSSIKHRRPTIRISSSGEWHKKPLKSAEIVGDTGRWRIAEDSGELTAITNS